MQEIKTLSLLERQNKVESWIKLNIKLKKCGVFQFVQPNTEHFNYNCDTNSRLWKEPLAKTESCYKQNSLQQQRSETRVTDWTQYIAHVTELKIKRLLIRKPRSLRRNSPEVRATRGQKLHTKIIYIVLQN